MHFSFILSQAHSLHIPSLMCTIRVNHIDLYLLVVLIRLFLQSIHRKYFSLMDMMISVNVSLICIYYNHRKLIELSIEQQMSIIVLIVLFPPSSFLVFRDWKYKFLGTVFMFLFDGISIAFITGLYYNHRL